MTPHGGIGVTLYEEQAVGELVPLRAGLTLAPSPSAPSTAESQGRPEHDDRVASLMSREALRRRLLALADITAASFAVVVLLNVFGERRVAAVAVAGIAVLLFLFKVAGLYDRDQLRVVQSTLDEVPLLAQITGLFALGVAILQSIALAGSLSADKIAALWIASFCTIVFGRTVIRALADRITPAERCLVIGDPSQVNRIRAKLAASQAHTQVIAALPLATEHVAASEWVGSPMIIRRVVNELNVHRIIIAPTTTDTKDVVDLIRVAKAVGVRVSLLPRMLEVVGSAVEFDDVDGMTLLGIRRFGLSRSSRLLKRCFDIAVGTAVLVCLSPLFLAISLAILLDSKGPLFFRQIRVGREGKHFRMIKFRSMVADADAQKDALRPLNEAGDGLFKLTNDPRVTRVGRFLRHTSLDELPQLLNVMRGEMSLVGPRPLVVDEDAQVIGLDRSRLHLTPGMTGPWQVLAQRIPMNEMVGTDYLYVANWSLWLDVKLLLRTVRHVARGGNH